MEGCEHHTNDEDPHENRQQEALRLCLFSSDKPDLNVVELKMVMPQRSQGSLVSDTNTSALFQIELQHDDWQYFDFEGHLWGLEVTHGNKGEKLVSILFRCH